MLIKTFGSAVHGIRATTITIEVNITFGIRFFIVGLADNAVKESQKRIESAIVTNGYEWPRQRVVVNMAPADIRKEGSSYDLPLALGILAAANQLKEDLFKDYVIMGELSLDGTVQNVRGVLPIALRAKKEGFSGIIVPLGNAMEAAVVEGLAVIGVRNLKEAYRFLAEESFIEPAKINIREEFLKKPGALRPEFLRCKRTGIGETCPDDCSMWHA
jgi:magnesium chelatase family protein